MVVAPAVHYVTSTMKKTSQAAKRLLLSTERVRNLRPDELVGTRGGMGGRLHPGASYSCRRRRPSGCDGCTATTIQCQYTNNK